MLLSFVLLRSKRYNGGKNTDKSLNFLLKQIRTQGNYIKEGDDFHAILSRGYHQTHMLMQRYTLDSALNSMELQRIFFTNREELSNKFLKTYKLSIKDFLCVFREFLVLSSDKKIFKLDDTQSLINEDNQKTEYFFNLISLDIENSNKVFNEWGNAHKMDFYSMKQDILKPFYPLLAEVRR